MRIGTCCCCLASGTVHRIGGNTQSTTNSHPQRDTYVCVCVCNCTHMPLCSTPQILAPASSKRRSCSYGALHSTEFSIKIQIDANKWPSPIPRRVSETQLQLHYQAKSIERGKGGERELLLADPGPALTNWNLAHNLTMAMQTPPSRWFLYFNNLA